MACGGNSMFEVSVHDLRALEENAASHPLRSSPSSPAAGPSPGAILAQTALFSTNPAFSAREFHPVAFLF
jgi:hypothetical protein